MSEASYSYIIFIGSYFLFFFILIYFSGFGSYELIYSVLLCFYLFF